MMYKSLIFVTLVGSAMIAGLSSCDTENAKEVKKAEGVLKEAAISETGNADGEIEDRAAQIKKIEKKLEEQDYTTKVSSEMDDTITVAL